MVTPAAMEASRILRRLNMDCRLLYSADANWLTRLFPKSCSAFRAC
jgi:hypothetical protein